MRSAVAESGIEEGHGMVNRRACKQNRENAKEGFAGHVAPAQRAMKYIAQLSATAEPTKSTKQ
jgi:hypothetical protein